MCGLSSIATTPRSTTATALPLASSQRLASPLCAFANTPNSAPPPSPVRTECATAVPQNDKPTGQGRFIPWDFGCACSAYRRCGQAGSAVAVVLMQEFQPLRIRSSHIVDCVNLRHKTARQRRVAAAGRHRRRQRDHRTVGVWGVRRVAPDGRVVRGAVPRQAWAGHQG